MNDFSPFLLRLHRANLGSQGSSYNGGSIASNQIEVVDQMQLKVNELCMKIDDLQRELEMRTGTVDRKHDFIPFFGNRKIGSSAWLLNVTVD